MWPSPPPKPDLLSGLLGVATEGTNMNGTACCACCSNNVQWMQFHSLFEELDATISNYAHMTMCLHTYYFHSSLSSLESQLCVPPCHRFYQQGPLLPILVAPGQSAFNELLSVPFVSTDGLSSDFSTPTLLNRIHTRTSAGKRRANISPLLRRPFSH